MDLYVVLGLPHGASDSEIKRAYRRLARRYHPDINPGDRVAADRFSQILVAYETLSDPERRSRYDAGDSGSPAERRGGAFEGFDFSNRGIDYSATFGDLFAEVLRERGDRPVAPQPGADLHQELRLSFADALQGRTQGVTMTRHETCHACAGSGRIRALAAACGVCHGAGAVRTVRGHMVFSQSCAACAG